MKRKKRKIMKEYYAPVEEWVEAPACYANLPLKDGEYTVIVHASGIGLYLVAKTKNIVRYCTYLDGVRFEENLIKVSPFKLSLRKKADLYVD